MNEPSVRFEYFTVRHSEVDRNASLRLDSLFDYMQEAAANNANDLGFGLKMLSERKRMWVLSRLKVKIDSTPSVGDRVRIETWASGVDKIFATREFTMTYEDDGREWAHASSCWLLLDSEKLRPLRIIEGLAPAELPDNSAKQRHFTDIDKLPKHEGLSFPMESFIHESFIDVNKHLNNARCVSILYDWLAGALKTPPQISEIQVNYTLATQSGSTLFTSGVIDGNDFYAESSGGLESEAPLMRFQASGRLR